MNWQTITFTLLLVLLPMLITPASGQTAGPVQPRPRYTLRAGDAITVDYRYTPEFNQTLTIQPDGFVNFSLIGELRVAGMTLDQVHAYIVRQASVRLKDPEVTVTLKEFERPYFAVAGEVEHPGKFDYYDKLTALQAVLLAGGFKGSAQQSDVYLFRRVNGDLVEVHKLDLKHMRRSTDLERDLALQPGDMILVPRNKLENISRFMKATNLGIYFDPLTYALP